MDRPHLVGYRVRQQYGCTQEDVVLCLTCFRVRTYAEQTVMAFVRADEDAPVCKRCLQMLGDVPDEQ